MLHNYQTSLLFTNNFGESKVIGKLVSQIYIHMPVDEEYVKLLGHTGFTIDVVIVTHLPDVGSNIPLGHVGKTDTGASSVGGHEDPLGGLLSATNFRLLQ